MKILLTQPATRSGDMKVDIEELLAGETVPECDVAVLPELIGSTASTEEYEQRVIDLAQKWDCHVVGGSHYLALEHGLVNSGVVSDSDGNIVTRYQKTRPYGSEIGSGVVLGDTSGLFELKGRKIAVLICSDVWFSESFSELIANPDVILIPSFSITQRGHPDKARELWKHMTVSRAYEYAAYVGVSDWAYPCRFDGLAAAGVTGLVNPRPEGDLYFRSQEGKFGIYELDFVRLDGFRANRAERGFLKNTQRDV